MREADPAARRAASPWQRLLYAPYLCAFATTWLCWAAGYVGAASVAVHHATTLALLLTFRALGRRDDLRWNPQRVAQLHLILSAVPFMVMTYPMQHAAGRATMLMVGLNVMAYGVLTLDTRRYLEVGGAFVVMYGAMLAWLRHLEPQRFSLVHEGLLAFTFVCASLVLALLGGQLHKMRHRLRQRTHDLDEAVGKLSALALRDDLTALPNRRALKQRLVELQHRLDAGGAGYAVALVDVDHFKRVNDVHGHAVGDAALRAVADVGAASTAAPDLFGRWGGEEFLLVLDAAAAPPPRGPAAARAEGLRAAVEAGAAAAAGLASPLTISVGLASGRRAQSVDAALAAADAMLYEAKRAGRNRVVVEVVAGKAAAGASPADGPRAPSSHAADTADALA